MNRRIVRVLMVLLVLLCVLPAVVGAAEYKVGDTLWTAGEKPTADTEQYSRWIPVIRLDNVQEYREVANTGTYEYQWIVEEYYGPGEKEGIPTSFAVKNVDPQGDPMVGTEFILFEERGDNLLMIASAITDEEGMAYLKDLCLDDNSDTAVWHLVQTNFPESQMAKTHHPYTGMWDIYVTRDSSGQHTLEMVPSPAAQTMTLGMDDEAETDQQVVDFGEVSGEEPVEENYNEKDKVLTVVNEKISGRLTIRVEFEDGVVPPGIEIFDVTVVSPDGYKETMTLTRQYPEVTLINAALGNYSFEQTSKMQVDGYNLKTKYMVELVGEDPVESQVVALTEEKTAATAIVLNCYEEVNIANTIHAKVMDKDGKLLKGAQLQLLDENDEVIRTVSETSGTGTFVFDDLANYAVKGETVKFKIRQSKVPEGYDACEYDFNITVEKNNGKVKVSPVKSEFFLLRLFNSGTDEDAAGETVIEFENKLIPSSLDLKIVNTGEACPVDEIPVTVTGLNDTREVTLSEENGWQVKLEKLPRATYTIKQDVDAEGFHLVEEYDAFGVDVTGNQVALKVKNAELTVKNVFSLKTGKLVVEMGFAEDVIPAALKSIPVKVTGRALYVKRDIDETVNVTAQNGWTAELELPLGTYTVAQDLTQLVAEGYELTPDPAQTKKVTLEEDKPITCAFTNQFTEREEPLPERIVIQMEDGEKKPVAGVRVGLFLTEDGSPHEFGPSDATGQIIIDDLAGKMEMISVRLKDGERLEAALRQTEVPDGYKLSEQEYQVFVEKNGDEIIYGVTDADTSETEILLTFTNDVVASEGPETPNDTLPEKIIVQMLDAEKNPVAGVKIGLFEAGGKYPLREVGPSDENGQIVVDNLERYVNMVAGMLSEGERKEIILKQTEVPEGYKLSEQEYSIAVEKTDGDIIYGGTGVDTSGTEVLVTFTNEAVQDDPPATNPTEPEPTEPKPTAPKPSGSTTSDDESKNQIGIRTLDTNGAPLAGAKYGLYYGATAIRSYTDYGTGQINIENLEMLLGNYIDDPAILYTPLTLRQTQPPLGGKLSSKTYDVYVYIDDEGMKVNVKGSEIDANGVQLVDFVHSVSEETQPTQATAPKSNEEEKEPDVIVIRTVDESGNVLSGAEYCLSTDLHFDEDKDIVYSKADRHEEITIEDLEEHVEAGKKATYYLMQCRQPEGGNLSADRFVVELSRKKGNLEIEVKKDAGILERMQGGGVEESTTGEWIVTFNSSAKTSTIQIGYEEVVDWHNCMEAEDVLQQYKKNEYEFQLNWEFAGEKKDPLILKLSNGESGSFDPIPLGAKYEIVPVQDGCYKLEFTKGELTGVATQANLDLKAKITYNIDKDAPLTIEMLKLDSKTEKPLPGVVYTLKNSEKEEVDVYKTDGSGKLLIDAITEPGEYTLSESEVPEGYHKLKKDIGISVSVAFKESVDGNGDPMILQTLEAVVSHSQVRQKLDGTYRIGTAQSSGSGILPVVLGAGAVVAVGAGAGVAVLHNKKRRGFRR